MSNQITRLSGDGWFDVAYDDGTFEKNVPRCRILRVTGELHLSVPLQTLFLASLTRSSLCFSRSDTADDTARQTYARERRRERRLKLKAKRRRRLLRYVLPLSLDTLSFLEPFWTLCTAFLSSSISSNISTYFSLQVQPSV